MVVTDVVAPVAAVAPVAPDAPVAPTPPVLVVSHLSTAGSQRLWPGFAPQADTPTANPSAAIHDPRDAMKARRH